MRVLGIDTSGRRGGVAVVEADQVLASRQIVAPKGFGDAIYPLIDEALAEAGLRLDQIDLFAAAAGPGSFTGVRVGLTAAKALAEALGKPVVGVSNLQALAAATDLRPCAAALDARRGEVYGAVYGDDLAPLVGETVLPWTDLLEQSARWTPLWVATDAAIFEPDGAAPLPPEAPRFVVDDVAAAIARLAPQLLQGAGEPELVEANYVRRPDAERNWRG